jgi:hypothetical protein
MIRAIKGMIAEQEQILIAFILAIFTFGLQLIGMYWIMMDNTSAIVTSVITVICMIGWYRYALRLYNRFSWSGIDVDWLGEEGTGTGGDNDKNPVDQLDELNPNLVSDLTSKTSKYTESNKKSMKDFQSNTKKKRDSATTNVTGIGSPIDISDKHSVVDGAALGDRFDLTGGDGPTHHLDDIQTVITSSSTTKEVVDAVKGMTFGSYLSMKERSNRFSGEKWIRRYFIIKGSTIYYFQDKRSFDLEPSKPLNKRPIELEGYTLVAGSLEPPYPISLVPYDNDDIRKVWKFRCDTSTEFERWIQLFTIALQSCNPNKQQGDLVMIADGRSEVISVLNDNLTNYGDER